MKKVFGQIFLIIVLNLFIFSCLGQNDSLLNILHDELWRVNEELQDEEYPPYYIEFRVSDLYSNSLSSAFGYIIEKEIDRKKLFSPMIRIGDYQFDNTHIGKNGFGSQNQELTFVELPIDNNPMAVKYKIWSKTNELYRNTLNEYLKKKSQKDDSETNKTADFAKQQAEKYFEPPLPEKNYNIDSELWSKKLDEYSAYLMGNEEIFISSANLNYTIERKYFVSSENTEIVQNNSLCVLSVFFIARSNEDDILPYFKTFYASSPEKLPSDSSIYAELEKAKTIIMELCKAPKAEPYSGPAILSAEAAGVFFHEIFGHRIEGHRFNESFDSKTFTDKIDKQVLNKNISIISDPTISNYENNELLGAYKYDEEGVKAQRVINVDNGILKNFLMSRKPNDKFNKSNGHGRGGIHSIPVARQSNLFIKSNKTYTDEQLRKKLKSECKKQKKQYGYYFKTVSGGFTNTMNYMPDFFNIFPVEVYKVYVDNKPDELVRGVNLIGTPLIMFSEIIAAGDKSEVFSGICGAESGYIPVSAISPAFLVKKIETQNQFVFEPDWPIFPDPEFLNNDNNPK